VTSQRFALEQEQHSDETRCDGDAERRWGGARIDDASMKSVSTRGVQIMCT